MTGAWRRNVRKMRPRRWRDDGGRTDGPTRGGRSEGARPPHRPRAFAAERAPELGEIVARLERLEALVGAIAEHLGIEAPASRQGRVVRRGARPGAGPAPARPEDHAVVKTVARRLPGRLKVYHAERGYGFLVSPDAPGDVFFHRSDCRTDPETLGPSSVLTFDLVEMANGQSKAVNVGPKT